MTNTGKDGGIHLARWENTWFMWLNEGAQQSLWVRQMPPPATSNRTAAGSRYLGLTFSQDGNYVYYVVYEKNSPQGIVYQIPVLGGSPRKIIEDVDTPITFSPDGRRFAFIRNYPRAGETALFIANSDGTGQQKIASRHRPERFGAAPRWAKLVSAGRLVVCPAARLEVVSIAYCRWK